ncbi:hypothetical protein [Pedobacter sp. SYP-B3415]|uniref:hypothetical protein n=1 Tax=Pedobacter sp. SYP-B3415 TaxID=2496641 RepID=UPI00101BD46B|nr:hypothetical protein [Pedobacter sp. SYP-B3415]
MAEKQLKIFLQPIPLDERAVCFDEQPERPFLSTNARIAAFMPVCLEFFALGIIHFSRREFVRFFESINATIMKTLKNSSPFLLMLFPVFMLLAVTATVNFDKEGQDEVVVKSNKSASGSIVKAAVHIFR